MEKDELVKLAEAVRDGKANEAEKLQLLQTLNFELGEVSAILEKAKKDKK